MDAMEWLTLLAILLGPILAVGGVRFLDDRKEKKARKEWVFHALMSTRAYTTSRIHVEALNRIDLDFRGKSRKERAVVESWKAYHDWLTNKPDSMSINDWEIRRADMFVDLLHTMAQIFGYKFDKTHIKKSSYAPRAHEWTEEENHRLRLGLIAVLEGRRSIPIYHRPPEEEANTNGGQSANYNPLTGELEDGN